MSRLYSYFRCGCIFVCTPYRSGDSMHKGFDTQAFITSTPQIDHPIAWIHTRINTKRMSCIESMLSDKLRSYQGVDKWQKYCHPPQNSKIDIETSICGVSAPKFTENYFNIFYILLYKKNYGNRYRKRGNEFLLSSRGGWQYLCKPLYLVHSLARSDDTAHGKWAGLCSLWCFMGNDVDTIMC